MRSVSTRRRAAGGSSERRGRFLCAYLAFSDSRRESPRDLPLQSRELLPSVSSHLNPVPLHVLHRIIPAPLHPVHSRGDRLVKPMTLSSFLSRFEIFTGASRRPEPSQKMHASPPLCAHAGHGSGSPFSPRPTAKDPMSAPNPAMEASCAASSSAVEGSTRGTKDAPRRDDAHCTLDDRTRLVVRHIRVRGAAGAAREVQHAIAGIPREMRAKGCGEGSRLDAARAQMAPVAWTSSRYLSLVSKQEFLKISTVVRAPRGTSEFGGRKPTRAVCVPSADPPPLRHTVRRAEEWRFSIGRA